MKFIETLLIPVLKAVAALANNGGDIFKPRKKAAFNPRITLGFNYCLIPQNKASFQFRR
ncbi:MAG: hypothetical protein ACHQHN_10770 [Sphingobacteriales bacterium]